MDKAPIFIVPLWNNATSYKAQEAQRDADHTYYTEKIAEIKKELDNIATDTMKRDDKLKHQMYTEIIIPQDDWQDFWKRYMEGTE